MNEPATVPTAVLEEPVVLKYKEPHPTAVLSKPVVLVYKEFIPTAVFS